MSSTAKGLASRIEPGLLVCAIHRASEQIVRRRGTRDVTRLPGPKYLLRKRAFALDEFTPPYVQRADRASAGQLLTWKEDPPQSMLTADSWKDAPALGKRWVRALRSCAVWAAALHADWSHSRSHLPVLATFVDYSDHWLGMISIAQCDTFTTECLSFTPDRTLSTLETTFSLAPCDRGGCDSRATGAAAVDVLRLLWNGAMDEEPVVPRERVLADRHLASYPAAMVREGVEMLATFHLVAEDENGLKLTPAGDTWLLAHERIGDRELLEDALPKERSNKIKATFHGDVVNATIAISGAKVGSQSLVVFDATQRRTLRELAELIEARRDGLELADGDAAELDEAVVALREAADDGTAAEPGRLRRALRTTARIGGGLLLGVSGNALYESAKAIIG
jgi:hypothetical protein